MKGILLAGIVCALAVPACAQAGSLQQVVGGSDLPHTLKLKELTGEWRYMGIQSAEPAKNDTGDMLGKLMQMGMMAGGDKQKNAGNDAAMGMLFLSMLGGMFGGGGGSQGQPLHYSRGQTLTIGSETFLVTYRYQPQQANLFEAAMQAQAEGKEPDPEKLFGANKLTEDAELTLTLINVRTIGTITNLRAFDLKRELELHAKAGGGGMMDFFAQAMQGKQGAGALPGGNAQPVEREKPALVQAEVRSVLSKDAALNKPGNRISVEVTGDVVVLTGTVTSRFMRDRAALIAEQALDKLPGSYEVRNELAVPMPRGK